MHYTIIFWSIALHFLLIMNYFCLWLSSFFFFFQRTPLMVASRAILLIGLQNRTKKKNTCFYTKFVTTRTLRFIKRLYLQIFTMQFVPNWNIQVSIHTWDIFIAISFIIYFFQWLSNWDSHNIIIMTLCIYVYKK